MRQLDRDGTQLRAYSFEGIWPQTVAEIGLDYNATDDVERYDVTFNVQYWSAAKDGDPYTSAVPRDTSGQINDIIS